MATLLAGKDTAADTDTSAETGAARVGAELRAARLRLGWHLPDVANSLRIRLPYLEAIEEGRVADLPGAAYAVGFVRTYATSLGLGADEVARRFRAEALEVNRKPELTFPAPVPQRGVPAGAVILVGVVIAGLGYAAWFHFSNGRDQPRVDAVPPVPARLAPLAGPIGPQSTPSPQVASIMPDKPVGSPAPPPAAIPAAPAQAVSAPSPPPSSPAAEPPVSVQPAPSAPVAQAQPAPAVPAAAATAAVPAGTRIAVQVNADAWVQVRQRGGKVLLNRVLRQGEIWPVPDEPNLILTTGNAGGTELIVDGQPAPSLGKPGAVRRDVALDPAALTAQAAPASAPASGPPASTPPPRAQ